MLPAAVDCISLPPSLRHSCWYCCDLDHERHLIVLIQYWECRCRIGVMHREKEKGAENTKYVFFRCKIMYKREGMIHQLCLKQRRPTPYHHQCVKCSISVVSISTWLLFASRELFISRGYSMDDKRRMKTMIHECNPPESIVPVLHRGLSPFSRQCIVG